MHNTINTSSAQYSYFDDSQIGMGSRWLITTGTIWFSEPPTHDNSAWPSFMGRCSEYWQWSWEKSNIFPDVGSLGNVDSLTWVTSPQ